MTLEEIVRNYGYFALFLGTVLEGETILLVSGFGPTRFLLLNVVGASVWASLMAAIGYSFGHTVQLVLGEVKRYEAWIVGVALMVGTAVWAGHRLKRRAGPMAGTK